MIFQDMIGAGGRGFMDPVRIGQEKDGYPGFPLGLENLKTLKNGKAFSSQGKSHKMLGKSEN